MQNLQGENSLITELLEIVEFVIPISRYFPRLPCGAYMRLNLSIYSLEEPTWLCPLPPNLSSQRSIISPALTSSLCLLLFFCQSLRYSYDRWLHLSYIQNIEEIVFSQRGLRFDVQMYAGWLLNDIPNCGVIHRT